MAAHEQTRWVRFCQDLARLRVELERSQEDEAFRAGGGEILYVVDTSVVHFFVNPSDNEKYVHIFRDSDDDLRALSYSVGDYLFLAGGVTSASEPLYMTTPHADELLTNLDALSYKALEQLARARGQMDQVRQLLAQFSRGDVADAAKVAQIIEKAPELMSVLHDGEIPSPRTELKRLSWLGTEGRLINADTSAQLPCLDPEALTDSTEQWTRWLRETKSKARSLPRIKRDAQVLAWLVDANDELRELEQEGTAPRRVHLLTGDDSILHAYNIYRKEIKDPVVRREHLLRHPRQFIPYILARRQKTTQSVMKDLIALLDRLFNPIRWIFKAPRDFFAALRTLQYSPETSISGLIKLLDLIGKKEQEKLVEEISSQWTEILNAASVSQPIDRQVLEPDEMSRQVAQLLMRQDVEKLLQQRMEELFNHLQGAYSTLGFLALPGFSEMLQELIENQKAGASHTRGRVAIALRFDAQLKNDFDDYHTQLRQALKRDALVFLRNVWGKMTPYMLNLTHAMIAAEASKWDICREYCRQAYEDADESRGEYPHEAAYFHAAAIRHNCHSQEEAAHALALLETARRHWQQAHPDETDWRLNAERWALSAAVMNHNAFCETGDVWRLPEAATMQQMWNGFWDLLDQPNIADIPQRITASPPAASWERRLYRQIVINLSGIYLHHRHVKAGIDAITPDQVRALHDLFVHYYPAIAEDDESYFTRFIKIMCDWESAREGDKAKQVTALEKHLREIEEKGTVLLEYEKRKFYFYLRRIREGTGASQVE